MPDYGFPAINGHPVNVNRNTYYGFNNDYMLHMIDLYKGTFVGTAVIDPAGRDPARLMKELAGKKVPVLSSTAV